MKSKEEISEMAATTAGVLHDSFLKVLSATQRAFKVSKAQIADLDIAIATAFFARSRLAVSSYQDLMSGRDAFQIDPIPQILAEVEMELKECLACIKDNAPKLKEAFMEIHGENSNESKEKQ